MQRVSRYLSVLGPLLIVFALSKVHARYVAPHPYEWHTSSRFSWSIAFIFLEWLVAYGLGLPDLVRSQRAAFVGSVAAAVGGTVAMSAVQLVVGDALLPRFVVFGSAVLLVPWYLVCTALAAGGRQSAEERDRVLLVGDLEEAERLRLDLTGAVERPATLVQFLSVERARAGVGGPRALFGEAVEERISVVVLNSASRDDESIVAQVAELHEQGVRVRTLSLFYEEWLGKLPASELERTSLMFDIGEVHRNRYARSKRLVDLPIALVGLVALVVVTPVVWLGNRFGNRGPLFFQQDRIGRGGEVFRILKFRTMRPTAGETSGWTTLDDPRVTTFGRLMRRTHVDELPQVLNILRGDLSVVGPRPEQPHYVEELRAKLPFYELRHLVHPGLTGWAQVKYGYAGDEHDALEKLQYEFFYLRHQGLLFDIRIIGRTVRSVFGQAGR